MPTHLQNNKRLLFVVTIQHNLMIHNTQLCDSYFSANKRCGSHLLSCCILQYCTFIYMPLPSAVLLRSQNSSTSANLCSVCNHVYELQMVSTKIIINSLSDRASLMLSLTPVSFLLQHVSESSVQAKIPGSTNMTVRKKTPLTQLQ